MSKRRILAVVIACMMVLAIPAVSQAAIQEEAVVSPRYTYTRSVEADLNIDSSGNATAAGGVWVYDTTSTISITVTLYRQTDTSWSRVDGWSDSVTGRSILEVEGKCKVSEKGTYKAVVTGTVKGADGGAEWITERSGLITYP